MPRTRLGTRPAKLSVFTVPIPADHFRILTQRSTLPRSNVYTVGSLDEREQSKTSNSSEHSTGSD